MTQERAADLGRYGAEALLVRQRCLERFSAWEKTHPRVLTSRAALNGVGFLYDLLPEAARTRPVDPSGVQALQRALSVLDAGD